MALSLGLPRKVAFFNAHKLAAAVVGIVAATGVTFSMSRWLVFRHQTEEDEEGPAEGEPAEPAEQLLSRPAVLAEKAS
jgi:dolichol-phosphate mannosyltransferase